jgi:hypothetical protein
MSITPVEGDREDGQENREVASDQHQGVRARVRSWLQSIGRQLWNLRQQSNSSERGSTAKRSSDDKKGEIRVSGQRRLEGPRCTPTRAVESVDITTRQPELPGASEGDTERDGNRLYNPDRPDAYITSDTWEDIER